MTIDRAARHSDLDARAASAIPNALATARPILDWNDKIIDRGKHARRAPAVKIQLSTGARISITGTRSTLITPEVILTSHDGHEEELTYGAPAILAAWAKAQAHGIALALHDPIEEDHPPQKRQKWWSFSKPDPQLTPAGHLANTIARRIEIEAPTHAAGKTYHTDVSTSTGWVDGKPNIQEYPSDWLELGLGVRILQSGSYDGRWVKHNAFMVAHEQWGVIYVPGKPILDAITERKERALDASLPASASAQPARIIESNATAGVIQRLCLQALKHDPNLTSSSGARIDALAHDHLPRLVSQYNLATRTAKPQDVQDLDVRLAIGLETVRNAVEDAINRSALDARNDFLTQLRFLELRHPESISAPPLT